MLLTVKVERINATLMPSGYRRQQTRRKTCTYALTLPRQSRIIPLLYPQQSRFPEHNSGKHQVRQEARPSVRGPSRP